MKQPLPKMSALVVSAIRNLREARGSTSKDIMNYILTEHHSGDGTVQRQMNAALRRGVDYGILKRMNGHYTLNGDPYFLNPQTMVPQERGRRRKRGRRKRGRRRGRKRGRGRRRGRKSAMRSRRRNFLNRKRGIHMKRVNRKNDNMIDSYDEKPLPMERTRNEQRQGEHRPTDVEITRRESSTKTKERSRSKSRHSHSQPREYSRQESSNRSQSQSSLSSDCEELDDNRLDD